MKFIKLTVFLLVIFHLNILHSQNMESFILKAPEKPFYTIKKIGVLEFDCSTNRRMNSVITNFLVTDLLDQYRGIYDKESKYWGLKKGKEGQTFVKGVKTDFYQIIERDQLQKVLREQRLSLSGAIDESSAAEVGRLLGLDVIIMGTVSYSSVDEKGSSLLGLASSSGSNCLTRKVNAKGTLKMVSVETAQIVGTKSAETELKIYKCDDQRSGIPRPEVMAETCMKQLAREFTDYFAPGYQFIDKGDFTTPYFRDMLLSGEIGLGFFNEDFKIAQDRSFVTGRWAIDFLWPVLPTVTLFHQHQGFPSLEDSSDYYITSQQGVRLHMWENFISSFQVNWRYDNTPSPGFKKSDYLYLLTLGYAFES